MTSHDYNTGRNFLILKITHRKQTPVFLTFLELPTLLLVYEKNIFRLLSLGKDF